MRALVTGCSSGIGRATAAELASRGYEVVATARRPESLDGLEVATRLALDVDDDASVADAVGQAGEIDVLVNNAGFSVGGPVEAVPLDEVKAMYETNVFGALRMMQAVLPGMRQRGRGTIVNVSSVAAKIGAPLGGLYASTKWALEAISEAVHVEEGHFGIRTVIIEPGGIDTRFEDNARRFGVDQPPWDELARAMDATGEALHPDGTPGPEAVAAVIVEAVGAPHFKLRWTVGADAELISGVRASSGDAEFEAAMRAAVNLDW